MTTTIEMLEQRVAVLEREVQELKQAAKPRPAPTDIWEKLTEQSPMIRKMLENSVLSPEQIAKYRKELGIDHIEPMGAENLQAWLIAQGHDPNSTETSRMLIEMRDEE